MCIADGPRMIPVPHKVALDFLNGYAERAPTSRAPG